MVCVIWMITEMASPIISELTIVKRRGGIAYEEIFQGCAEGNANFCNSDLCCYYGDANEYE